MKTLGATIRSIRVSRKLTLREFADQLGISIPYLSDIEHSKRIPTKPELVEAIGDLCDLPPIEVRRLAEASRLNAQGEEQVKERLALARAIASTDIDQETLKTIQNLLGKGKPPT